MHTFEFVGGHINYNQDMSGDAEIHTTTQLGHASIPARALLDFVAECVQREKIATLEQASTEALLGLPEWKP